MTSNPATSSLAPAVFLDYDRALACIHCGLCLGSCPTYLETGNENDSPRGRIYLMRALQDGRLPAEGTVARHIDRCLGCRACEVACPSGVHYGELLEATRDHLEQELRRPWLDWLLRRVAIEQVFPYPWRMKLALGPTRVLRRLGLTAWLPARWRDALALVPESCDATPVPEFSPADPAVPRRGRVGMIPGCVMSVMFGGTHAATIRLLNQLGYDVVAPAGQGCCGALHAHGGRLKAARAAARANIVAFEGQRLDTIIINAAGCGSTLKDYGQLLAEDPRWRERGARFSARVRDLTEWLVQAGLVPERAKGPRATERVTYHDACHLAHAQRITRPPRDLVRAVAGANFIELPEADVCCGSAGSYNLTEPELAARLQQRKIRNILGTGADVVVTSNPGCLLQIQAGLQAAGAGHIRVRHIADYLVAAQAGVGRGT